ncbi:hypothetical protein DM01DRAFT_1374134 [Hesseltinella vesiculosa]|uniref:F-box domain-containing protein n=1 Tax=Hesseltinella vesiculosa TaxID=101127 RepID=A0A1X2GHP6_9FUNG|nr:hypothetical protein DM01DRAFT_1374134 [Hesseltinella vesiculosa]
MGHLNRLPLELMQILIDLLDVASLCQLSRVNQRWYEPCMNQIYDSPLLTTKKKHDSFFECTNERTQRLVRRLHLKSTWITNAQLQQLKHCHRLSRLQLDHCPHLLPSSLDLVISGCVMSIQHMSLANNQLSQSTLRLLGLASANGQLRYLDLRNTMIRPCGAIDASHHLDALLLPGWGLFYRHSLAHLDLSYCNWVDDTTLANLAQALPLLQFISLRWCQRLSDKAVGHLIQQLKHLNMIDLCFVSSINRHSNAHRLLRLNPWLQKIGFTFECKSIWLQRNKVL